MVFSNRAETLYCLLRNRIIEHLRLVSSVEQQIAYQMSAATVPVSDELFNAWRDWVADEAVIDDFTVPVFSTDERLAVREFNATVDAVAKRTQQNLPHITNFIDTPAWRELSIAASKALAVFQIRGMSPEDVASN